MREIRRFLEMEIFIEIIGISDGRAIITKKP